MPRSSISWVAAGCDVCADGRVIVGDRHYAVYVLVRVNQEDVRVLTYCVLFCRFVANFCLFLFLFGLHHTGVRFVLPLYKTVGMHGLKFSE